MWGRAGKGVVGTLVLTMATGLSLVAPAHAEGNDRTQVNGKTTYYGTMPTKCPKKFLPVKAELTFAGLGGLKEETVTAEYKAPCPRKH